MGVFEANRNADGAGLDAGFAKLFEGHVVVRGVNREHDQGFDTAETDREKENAGAIAEAARGGQAAFEIEGQHGPKIFHLLFGKRVIGMRFETRVVDASDLGMLFEKFGDFEGVLTLPFDAHAERFHPANEQEGGFGVHGAAKVDDHVANFFDEVGAAGHGAGDDVGVAAEIFGGAVHHQVETHFDGLLQRGAGEGVVDHRDEIVPFGEGRGFFKVDQAQGGIAGRFDVKHFGAGGEQVFDTFEVGFNVANGNAEAWEDVAHEAVATAIDLIRGDDFVAGAKDGEKRAGNCGHARGGNDGGFGAFESGDFILGDGQGWIAVAGVNVGVAFAFGPAFHFGGVGEGEGGSARDGRAHVGAHAVFFLAVVDGGGGGSPVAVGAIAGGVSGAVMRAVSRAVSGVTWGRSMGAVGLRVRGALMSLGSGHNG